MMRYLKRLRAVFDNPVFVNEMRQSPLRKWGWVAVAGGLIATAFLIMLAPFLPTSVVVVWLPILFMPVIVPGFAAPMFAREYDQQTWQDLYLTRLSNREVVLGKFMAAVVQVTLVSAVFVPGMLLYMAPNGPDGIGMTAVMQAIGLMFTWHAFVLGIKVLLSIMLFVALAMVCSRYSRTRRMALVASYVSLALYAGMQLALWSMAMSWGGDNAATATPTGQVAADAGFMTGVHLVFCAVAGIGLIILMWVSMGVQRGFRTSGDQSAGWQPGAAGRAGRAG